MQESQSWQFQILFIALQVINPLGLDNFFPWLQECGRRDYMDQSFLR